MEELLEVTGRWPLLLGLVNGVACADIVAGADPSWALTEICDQLTTAGVTALDLQDAADRHRAVTATLEGSLYRLTPTERDRYRELAIFGEDVEIPLSVLAGYWAHTGGTTSTQVKGLCRRLADLSLLAGYRLDLPGPRVRLHDVVRDYLRHDPGIDLEHLHAELVDAHRDVADSWWHLPVDQSYLWNYLPTHLHFAGLVDELTATVIHPEWLDGKLSYTGPAALESDLTLAGNDPACAAMAAVVRQNAHLLAPLDPPGALTATLASRTPDDGPTAGIPAALTATIHGLYLTQEHPLPDLPHPALTAS